MANENLVTRPGNIDQINEKVLKYETFLSERLRPDLKAALEERDKLYAETAEFLALKNSIEAIKASKLLPGEPLKTKVDLGSNFYCQAVVPNPSRIIIEVGLGFYVEFTHDEGLAFIDKRVKLLEDKAKELTYETTKLKANIKLVLQGLREMQNIPEESSDKSKNRDPLFG